MQMLMFKGYRTVLFNILAGLPILLEVILSVVTTAEFGQLVPVKYMSIYTLVVVIGNVWLRSRTDTALGEKR